MSQSAPRMESPAPDAPDAPGGDERPWWTHRAPWLAFVIGIAVTVAIAWALSHRIRQVSVDRFEALVQQLELQLGTRLNAYIQILRGAQGLWYSGAHVDRESWRKYVAALELQQNFRGMQGIGYAAIVAPEALDRFEQGVRAEGAAQPAALQPLFADFAVHPREARPFYTAVTYLEPFTDRNLRAFGYDMFSEPVRREAMERARDTGEPALSGQVRLVQETETDVQPGFVVYLPIYRNGVPKTIDERRRQLIGWVYGPFRALDFMRNAIPYKGLYVQYTIYDGETVGDDKVLFSSDRPVPVADGDAKVVSDLVLAGHHWSGVSRPGALLISGADRIVAMLVGAAGSLISALLFALTLAWSRTRHDAEQMALQMTADLRQREQDLEKISARLAQSNDDLQQFVYAASHDLKEPLRSIASSLGLVTQRYLAQLDEGAREFLGYANDGAQRMSDLIDRLLDYSRIHTEASPLNPVDLDDVLDQAVHDMAAVIADGNAQIEREALPRVLANREQILRVFENLIGNAIKYSRRQTPAPRVQVAARREGSSWVIGITDNGIGIPAEYHDKIFTMFKRLHTRDQYEGTGLGLALCKRIVQRHGGEIWVRSEPGKGASFYFSLVAYDSAAAAAIQAREKRTLTSR